MPRDAEPTADLLTHPPTRRSFESYRPVRGAHSAQAQKTLARAEISHRDLSRPRRKLARASSLRSVSEELRRRHVPHRRPPPRPHSGPAVDREAPAATERVFPDEGEHAASPGGGGREPLLAEHALHDGGAGVWPRRAAPGAGVRGHQGGRHFQIPPT